MEPWLAFRSHRQDSYRESDLAFVQRLVREEDAQVEATLTAPSAPSAPLPNASATPVDACHLRLHRAAVPVRMVLLDERGQPDVRLSPRPTIVPGQ